MHRRLQSPPPPCSSASLPNCRHHEEKKGGHQWCKGEPSWPQELERRKPPSFATTIIAGGSTNRGNEKKRSRRSKTRSRWSPRHPFLSDQFQQVLLAWMTKMKEKIYSIAFQSGSDGRRVLSLKFVEAVILIYTPDPSGSSELPTDEGKAVEINMSWLRKGHPLLNVGDLSVEASERLHLLLDQLRTPTSLGVSMMIALVNRRWP